jgi:hypothetical protein
VGAQDATRQTLRWYSNRRDSVKLIGRAKPTFGFFLGWNETANVANCAGTFTSNCGTSNDMNFLNTGAFSLNTDGLGYSSASGVFLSQTGSSAPEPSSLFLLCGGGLLLAGALRGRRSVRK